MVLELKENRVHGTKEYPFSMYYMFRFTHGFQFPVHWHDEIEIIYIEEGMLNLKIGASDYLAKAGDIFFVNSKELHLMGSEDGKVKYYTFLFPIDFVSFQTPDEFESEIILPIKNMQMQFPKMIADKEVADIVRLYIKKIIRLNTDDKTGDIDVYSKRKEEIKRNIQTKINLLEIIQELYDKGCFSEVANPAKTEMQREILNYIQDNYMDKITLAMLAQQFHMSEKYVSNYFVQNFHLPFSNYVVHLRLTEAAKLLETTDLPVTEVGIQVGFYNTSYFIRAFKKAYGMAPLQYRKKVQ